MFHLRYNVMKTIRECQYTSPRILTMATCLVVDPCSWKGFIKYFCCICWIYKTICSKLSILMPCINKLYLFSSQDSWISPTLCGHIASQVTVDATLISQLIHPNGRNRDQPNGSQSSKDNDQFQKVVTLLIIRSPKIWKPHKCTVEFMHHFDACYHGDA